MTGQRTGLPSGRDGFFHEGLIYDSDAEFLTVAVPFLRDGVTAGEPTFFTGDRHQRRLLRRELGDLPEIALQDGDLMQGPLSSILDTYRLHREQLDTGVAQIRMLGAVPHDPWRQWVRFEAAINHVFASLPVWGICAYDARRTPDEVLRDVTLTHPHLAAGARRGAPNRSYCDPEAFVSGRSRDERDPLEDAVPDLELNDPTPGTGGRSVLLLAERTHLAHEASDALALSVREVVANAIQHGHPPVRLCVWTATDRVVVTVSDAGPGPTDMFVGWLPRDPLGDLDHANPLHVIRHATSEMTMFTEPAGFTVRLVQRADNPEAVLT